MLDKLLLRAKKLYKEKQDTSLKNIIDMLEYDNCFNELSVNQAINLLYDLGFNEEEAKKIYFKIMSK